MIETHVARLFDEQFSDLPSGDKSAVQLALVAGLALATPERVARENLPESVLAYYPITFDRMEKLIQKNCLNPEFSPHTKYAGFLLLTEVPCGAATVYLNSSIPFSSVMLAVPRMRSVKPLTRYFNGETVGPWFRSHLDSDYLLEFSAKGWDKYYMRVAELLRARPHVRGLVGTCWFHDPRLADISPRLAFLSTTLESRGAFLMRHRSSSFDIEMATKACPNRRRLYQEKKYLPTSYSMMWGRRALLAWAQTQETGEAYDKAM
jgi:hypothetical protein